MISIHLEDGRNIQTIFHHMNQNMVKKWYIKGIRSYPTGDLHPGALLPAIALGKAGDVCIVPMQWGMTFPPIPGKTSASFLYEIPTDISTEKKTRLWAFHRCLIPMSWYYEHEYLLNHLTGKSDYGNGRFLCQPAGTDFSYLACIYHIEEGFPTFAVCTCPSCMDIFPRMPVIFGKDTVHLWLSPKAEPDSLFRYRFLSLITDYEANCG